MRARRESLQAQIAAVQADLNRTELQSENYEALQQRVIELQNGYQEFTQKRDNSLVGDLMDQQQWLNVAVVQYPTLSLTPSHPQPKRDLPFGFITALLLGGCVVFLLETMREEVSTPAELELASRYPVLATVPFAKLPSQFEPPLAEPAERINSLSVEPGTSHFDQGLGASPARERHA